MASLAVVSENRGHLREALQIADDAVLLADQSPGRLDTDIGLIPAVHSRSA